MRYDLINRLCRFFLNKRGMSLVISSVILACAVITLGFVVLYWTQQRAFEANVEYSDTTDENIAKIGERMTFEHIFYNYSENTLSIYLINCGKSNYIVLDTAYLSNGSWSQTFSDIELKFLNSTETENLDIGEEGYFKISVNLVSFYMSYFMRITTVRGNQFETNFIP
ncbi:MAG: hypothetical protein JSV51_01960 [Candidatus Bathyarchaeota archaeon]|nr:MAG: hypothetical protein JSV51_01960 [Candidatus Bathyarchaeota archaeon]